MMRQGTVLGQQGILYKKPHAKLKSPDTKFELVSRFAINHCAQCDKRIIFGRIYCSVLCQLKGPKPTLKGPDLFA